MSATGRRARIRRLLPARQGRARGQLDDGGDPAGHDVARGAPLDPRLLRRPLDPGELRAGPAPELLRLRRRLPGHLHRRHRARRARSDAGGLVEIRGPETFDIDLLAYIGATTKTSGRTVGGFGEGFKICALIGARDFGLSITAGSGAHEIAVFFDPVPLGRELCYRVTTREGDPLSGSYVRLEGCDDATLSAFRAAPAMFRHPDNPKLARPRSSSTRREGVGVYAVGGRARRRDLLPAAAPRADAVLRERRAGGGDPRARRGDRRAGGGSRPARPAGAARRRGGRPGSSRPRRSAPSSPT